jgi:phenylalanyl-tRNA synthetase beta chain
MKVSLKWSQYYANVPLLPDGGVDELARKIGAQLGAVEEITDWGAQYKGIVIAEIAEKRDHPQADKLVIYQANVGGEAPVQVVAGDKNLQVGNKVAWIPPGMTVPATYYKEPFVLEARPLRGETSNGMFGSGAELLVNDNHERVLVLDTDAAPGTPFAEAYHLDDHIIDIENKMFTHRPDCFGQLGVARELAGIQQKGFKSPDWYNLQPSIPTPEVKELKLEVHNELPQLVPRFTAITMSNIEVRPSPIWLQTYLSRVGMRPINNLVDLSNYYMMLSGQPIHIYDYDKVKSFSKADSAKLVVRNAKDGEQITVLGGKTIKLKTNDMMVSADDHVACVGGAIGGADTEVSNDTRNIIIEAANWDMYTIRRTSMEHGLFTDAVTRFSKGQSPLQNDRVVAKIVDDIKQLAGGKIAGHLIDIKQELPEPPEIIVRSDFINARLGLQLADEEMAQLLRNIEFDVQLGDELSIKAPFWRTDIEIPEDIVEEIGRLYGYDHLPIELPERTLKPPQRDPLFDLKTEVRDILADAGANEVLTYSFVHGNLLDKAGQNRERAFQLSNALSPDLQYYRTSLTPSLLERIHANVKAGHDSFALFEIGKAHVKGEPDPVDAKVPKEVNAVSVVFAADEKAARQLAGAPFYAARKYLNQLLQKATWDITLEPLEGADLYQNPWIEHMTAPYDPRRSAVLRDNNGMIWGVVGEYKISVRKALKLPAFTAGFEIDPLLLMPQTGPSYTPLSRYPKVEQDISLKVSTGVTYQTLYDELEAGLRELTDEHSHTELLPLDIYQKDDTKHVTFRLQIVHYDKTLVAAEVNELLDKLAARAKEKVGAERI